LSFNLGLKSEVMMEVLPIDLRIGLDFELIGFGSSSDFPVDRGEEGWKNMNEIDLGGEFCFFGGVERDAKMRVVLSNDGTTEKFLRGIPAKRKNQWMARGGVYRWTVNEFKGLGFTYGLALKSKKHAQITLVNDQDYYYQNYRIIRYYADIIWTPRTVNSPDVDRREPTNLGWRVGFSVYHRNYSNHLELSLRPTGTILAGYITWRVGFGGAV
ncbi:MAG: hypothetical protein AAF193_03965, partial [Bacteroidota bacterium]